ncbi:evolutionarily conserved signaling intermediate in Toll pathway [Tropilaelaps mercedesae]|uniref:Evolutionarily conserved signaling intermediate in Toll pathway, mitochondrial n=1 Tax=Tropilaelaps mercedesae TaxID=418985 RepID=A0A1V9WZG2_9ACAR|nr:evolutionarily conserved signaling intermediate in Toll pathway [Tropilaelaps mercedesae]
MRLGRVALRGAALVNLTPGSIRFVGRNAKFPSTIYAHPGCAATLGYTNVQRFFCTEKKVFTTVSKRTEMFQIESDRVRDKRLFLEIIQRFKTGNPNRKGHVEFILSALDKLQEFQVLSDLQVYKELLDLFPKGKMIPKTLIQADLRHYPHHQDTALQIFERMEDGGVMPDREIRQLILQIFGPESLPFKKLGRMMYWMPKFKNASPYPLPKPVPREPHLLARLAIERITNVDLESEVVDFSCADVSESIDKTWIVSGQSPKQRALLAEEDGKVPLRIEGPHRIWLRDCIISYFILVGEPRKKPEIRINTNDVSSIRLTFFGEKPKPSHDLSLLPSVHEQTDATIYAVCSTGTSSRDSLLSWLRLLQNTNPCLGRLPVVFKLLAPTKAVTKGRVSRRRKKLTFGAKMSAQKKNDRRARTERVEATRPASDACTRRSRFPRVSTMEEMFVFCCSASGAVGAAFREWHFHAVGVRCRFDRYRSNRSSTSGVNKRNHSGIGSEPDSVTVSLSRTADLRTERIGKGLTPQAADTDQLDRIERFENSSHSSTRSHNGLQRAGRALMTFVRIVDNSDDFAASTIGTPEVPALAGHLRAFEPARQRPLALMTSIYKHARIVRG